jgi:primase-polymerase (primpol)-like protein
MKQLTSLATALALAASAAPVTAHNKAAGVAAGVIAAGLIGAAIAKHQHKRGYKEYNPHPDVTDEENVVGRCVHHGLAEVQNAGGDNFKLDHVISTTVVDDGSTRVKFVATRYYSYGHKTNDVNCVVLNGEVVEFKYS